MCTGMEILKTLAVPGRMVYKAWSTPVGRKILKASVTPVTETVGKLLNRPRREIVPMQTPPPTLGGDGTDPFTAYLLSRRERFPRTGTPPFNPNRPAYFDEAFGGGYGEEW